MDLEAKTRDLLQRAATGALDDLLTPGALVMLNGAPDGVSAWKAGLQGPIQVEDLVLRRNLVFVQYRAAGTYGRGALVVAWDQDGRVVSLMIEAAAV